MKTFRTVVRTIVLTILVLIAAGLIYIFSGAYDIGQDVPHTAVTHWLLNVARERSIDTHDADVQVPALTDPTLVANGAQIYSTHCAGCHLAPGKADSAIRKALYPRPPQLDKAKHLDPAEAFWVIKHGIKFTAMPAWGTSLSDAKIWSLVAFLQKQPTLDELEYQALLNAPGPTLVPDQGAAPTPPPQPATAATPTPAPATTAQPPQSH